MNILFRNGAALLFSASALAACGNGGNESAAAPTALLSPALTGSAPAPAPAPVPEPAAEPDPEPTPVSGPVPDPGFVLPAPVNPAPPLAGECAYPAAVQADFVERDKLPQYTSDTGTSSWGPWPARYAAPAIPANCDARQWQRERIIAVAKKYVGLPYRHHHVPGYDGGDGPGLDCSNFTAWVYNYGLGIGFNSGIGRQADTAGRRLGPAEPLQAGDLLFISTTDRTRISHVVIYIDPQHVIDSTGPGVAVRAYKGWYATRFSHARRVIE